MKFYRDKFDVFWKKIRESKITAINQTYIKSIIFYNNGVLHNSKNAAYIRGDIYKTFNLNDKIYGFQHSFTKESWRRFTKLRAFL
jgi:hypothetical protein